jgi:hypothetical protein
MAGEPVIGHIFHDSNRPQVVEHSNSAPTGGQFFKRSAYCSGAGETMARRIDNPRSFSRLIRR